VPPTTWYGLLYEKYTMSRWRDLLHTWKAYSNLFGSLYEEVRLTVDARLQGRPVVLISIAFVTVFHMVVERQREAAELLITQKSHDIQTPPSYLNHESVVYYFYRLPVSRGTQDLGLRDTCTRIQFVILDNARNLLQHFYIAWLRSLP
jgi:hypothetical protein